MAKKKGATRTDEGVSEEMIDSQAQIRESVDQREEMLESILQGRFKDLEKDEVDLDAMKKGDEEEPPGEAETEEGVSHETSEELSDEEEAPAEEEAEKEETEDQEEEEEPTEELVVDGEKKPVPLSKIVDAGRRALQKQLAADKALEEAKAQRREAEKLLADARASVETAKEEEAGDEERRKGDRKTGSRLPRDRAREIVEKLQYGETEEAVDALEEILDVVPEGKAPGTVDLEEVSQKVRDEIVNQQINDNFYRPVDQGGFVDIDDREDPNDPQDTGLKFGVFQKLVMRRLDQGEPHNWDTYRSAAIEARGLFAGETPKETPREDGFDEKKKKKREATDSIKGVSAKETATETGEDVEQTIAQAHAQAIEETRKARGQPF
jgi:hypothetical protein